MGRFSGKSSKAAREAKSIIRINPYELPEKALAVIAKICGKNQNIDVYESSKLMYRELAKEDSKGENWWTFYVQHSRDFYNESFRNDLNALILDLHSELQAHENTSDTQVVVAGGFSAGKSSLLNMLVGVPNLLPTGIEPCSMVPTYIYCSKNRSDIEVKGINLKKAVVQLDTDILQSIQHESKSKIYLASVLDKLFVELPSDLLDGLVFIDTPGYNNSEIVNDANGKTDEQTALEELECGNVLLWVVDSGNGTISANDKQKIETYLAGREDRKLIVLFNKADKKGMVEMKRIVDAAVSDLMSSSFKDRVIDILGYSAMENKVYYSASGYTLNHLIQQIRCCGTGKTGVNNVLEKIDELFQVEINWFEECKQDIEKYRKENLEDKDRLFKCMNENKEYMDELTASIDSVLIDSYNEVQSAADKLIDGWHSTLDKWLEFHNGVVDFENNDHWGSSNILTRAIQGSDDNYSRYVKQYNRTYAYEYYKESYREELLERLNNLCSHINSSDKDHYEDCEKIIKRNNKNIKTYDYQISIMKHYHNIVMDTLRQGIRMYQQCAHQVQDARLNMDYSQNVFAAIAKGSYEEFTACFAKGVNLNDFSADGYSPLTYAVKEGNIDMVRFFVEQGADLYAYDGRGQNAFHTAVQNGYRHICEYLLSEEPALGSTKTQRGEDVMNVSCQNDFSNWLSRNI